MLEIINGTITTTQRSIIHGLSHQFAPSSLSLIQGRNGVGKSTLLRALCGLQQLSAGSVWWQQHRLIKPLACSYTAPKTIQGAQSVVTYHRFTQAVMGQPQTVLSIPTAWHDIALDQLSMGQRKWVQCAALLDARQTIWLLDEPFAYLDQTHQQTLERCLIDHQARGGIIIFASHEATTLPLTTTIHLQ